MLFCMDCSLGIPHESADQRVNMAVPAPANDVRHSQATHDSTFHVQAGPQRLPTLPTYYSQHAMHQSRSFPIDLSDVSTWWP